MTQQLARWRAGPCSRPPARPGPLAVSPPLCALGCRKKWWLSAEPAPLGEGRSSRVVSARRKCGQDCFRAGYGKVVLGFREPRELGFQEKHTQPTNSGGGRESFPLGAELEGHVRECSVFCQIMPKKGLKTPVSFLHFLKRSARVSLVISTGVKCVACLLCHT